MRSRSLGARACCGHSWKAATEQLIEHYKAACAAQNVTNNAQPSAVHAGMRFRANQLAKRTTMYAIRKLLP